MYIIYFCTVSSCSYTTTSNLRDQFVHKKLNILLNFFFYQTYQIGHWKKIGYRNWIISAFIKIASVGIHKVKSNHIQHKAFVWLDLFLFINKSKLKKIYKNKRTKQSKLKLRIPRNTNMGASVSKSTTFLWLSENSWKSAKKQMLQSAK